MERFRDVDSFAAWRRGLDPHLRVGFVPTMGFLHAGHTSLMDLAREHCDILVVSNFVNPLQFGPAEDLSRYPRDSEGDAKKCADHATDAILEPGRFYPDGFATRVTVGSLASGLCGARRPGHFEGVATVVARLFGVVRPEVAVFGEKDYQQLLVIRRMTDDLGLGVRIVGAPLVRDRDGLALSSRNRYLSPIGRLRALTLSRALFAMANETSEDAAAVLARGRSILDVDRLDYLEVVGALDLEPLARIDRPARAMVAAFIGSTRLIDNVPLRTARIG
jgi:pantoate--beta-alanine ligase